MQVTITKEAGQDFITVKLPISKRSSASGKTTVVASTNGNHTSSALVDGKAVIVGFNAYIK